MLKCRRGHVSRSQQTTLHRVRLPPDGGGRHPVPDRSGGAHRRRDRHEDGDRSPSWGQRRSRQPCTDNHGWHFSHRARAGVGPAGSFQRARTGHRAASASGRFLRVGSSRSRRFLLVVEVAESSIDFDREIKARVYARAGLPEYWLVDLNEDVVHVHSDPSSGVHRAVASYRRDQSITPRLLPTFAISTLDLLGPETS